MRLINCRTYALEEFLGSDVPHYAILSHTWGKEEVTFADLMFNLAAVESRPQFRKIAFTCRQALAEGIDYAWVDTVCIDKSSSAELSEAINSMFKWYAGSKVCYAYLIDVTKYNFDKDFPQSRWFRRGWTLQELIAPPHFMFFDSAWQSLGSKRDHADLICNITRIDKDAIAGGRIYGDNTDSNLRKFCVARRMAWASQRETTRVEDIAYCLLGIFNVNMPLLYGEGKKAFLRLQQEIIKNLNDDSILAWRLTDNPAFSGMPHCAVDNVHSWCPEPILARSPRDFANCHDLEYVGTSISPFSMTNMGLQVELPLVRFHPPRSPSIGYRANGWVGLLNCSTSSTNALLGIVLISSDDSTVRAYRVSLSNKPSQRSGTTVLVGPRVAAQAVSMKITLINKNESHGMRNYLYGQRQFIPTLTKAFRSLGYNVATASGFNIAISKPIDQNYVSWNSEAEVFTASGHFHIPDLVLFDLHSTDARFCPKFTVLVRNQRLLVRRGTSFSDQQLRRFYNILGKHGPGVGVEEDLFVERNNGQRLKVQVAMTCKSVHHWDIVEVCIDAVPS